MKINNKEVSVKEAIEFANIDNVLFKYRKNNILLNDYQVNILNRNNIDYNKFSSIEQLLFEIEDILSNDYDEELDIVSSQLAELSYYRDTKK